MSFSILIPARLASTRLPDKPLADIAGVPMVAGGAACGAVARAPSGPGPAEGKTTVAVNLDAIIALSGKKVALVDATTCAGRWCTSCWDCPTGMA